jgi:sugar phosphate isomerase/epimerase
MKIGLPLFLEETLENTAKFCKENKLNFIELNTNFPNYRVNKLDVDSLIRIAAENEIYYTLHLTDTFSPCDFHDAIASAYTEMLLEAIEVAKRVNIPIINIHLSQGEYCTLPTGKVYLFERYQEEYMEKLTKFRYACESAVGDSGIKICVENCVVSERVDIMEKTLEVLMKSPVFGLTLDVGHNAINNFADEPTILKYAEQGKLHHMHIHDVIGAKDHLPLSEGIIELMEYIDIAHEYECSMLIEVKTPFGAKRSIEWLKEREEL